MTFEGDNPTQMDNKTIEKNMKKSNKKVSDKNLDIFEMMSKQTVLSENDKNNNQTNIINNNNKIDNNNINDNKECIKNIKNENNTNNNLNSFIIKNNNDNMYISGVNESKDVKEIDLKESNLDDFFNSDNYSSGNTNSLKIVYESNNDDLQRGDLLKQYLMKMNPTTYTPKKYKLC